MNATSDFAEQKRKLRERLATYSIVLPLGCKATSVRHLRAEITITQEVYSKKNRSSNFLSRAVHRIRASFAVGQNCPVSMELMVFLETPIISANAAWEMSLSALATFSLFFSTISSFILVPPSLENAYIPHKEKGKKTSLDNAEKYYTCHVSLLLEITIFGEKFAEAMHAI